MMKKAQAPEKQGLELVGQEMVIHHNATSRTPAPRRSPLQRWNGGPQKNWWCMGLEGWDKPGGLAKLRQQQLRSQR